MKKQESLEILLNVYFILMPCFTFKDTSMSMYKRFRLEKSQEEVLERKDFWEYPLF